MPLQNRPLKGQLLLFVVHQASKTTLQVLFDIIKPLGALAQSVSRVTQQSL
jgi:hypothetical protein